MNSDEISESRSDSLHSSWTSAQPCSMRNRSTNRPTALLLLFAVVAMTTGEASAYPSVADPAAADYSEGGEMLAEAKRQLEPPVKPMHFKSIDEFKLYMKELEAYLKLLGRQRFGKRSGRGFTSGGRHRQSASRDAFEQLVLTALGSIDSKLDGLIELSVQGSAF